MGIAMMTAVVVSVIACLHVTESIPDDACPTNACAYSVQEGREYSHFNMNDRQLDTVSKYIIIHKQNMTSCVMNTTEIIELYDFGSEPIIGFFVFHCINTIRVHLLPYEGNKLDNVISYLQLSNCNMSVSDWNTIAAVADMRVFSSLLNNYVTEDPCGQHNSTFPCNGLHHTVSFMYENRQSATPDVTAMLSCLDEYPEMAEVTFTNMSWTSLPRVIPEKFPNLQTLDIPHNNFILPPSDFPWNDEAALLPRNLSRTAYMDNHYSKSGTMNLLIEPNIYRRMFNLNYNRIVNLSNFSFHGYLHMIGLKGNKMVEIGYKTFQNVTGLQHIDLSDNRLKTLPTHLFRGLTEMRHLDISGNEMVIIETGTVDDMESLIFLNAANNSLEYLDRSVFSRLRQLEVIHLEYNKLATLHPDTFPVESLVLRDVYLHNNPLAEIPEFLFWLRGLVKADLHSTNITLANLTEYLLGMDSHRLLDSVIDSGSDTDIKDILQRPQTLRIIDLSSCQIDALTFNANSEIKYVGIPIGRIAKLTMQILLLHFKFILTDNPINCSCKILPVNNLIAELKANRTVKSTEYYFTDWICQSPSELANKPMLSIRPEETYCRANLFGCPDHCQCYRRSVNNNTIVDCRGRNLERMHATMPGIHAKLELWYSGNNVTVFDVRPYLHRVTNLDLSHNRISSIDTKVFRHVPNLQTLFLHSNLLSYLPENVRNLKLRNLTIDQNPFTCDCHSHWMKTWIVSLSPILMNWNKITCNNQEVGKEIVNVSDDNFVCQEEYDSLRHVIVPAVTCSVILVIMLVIVVALYAYRLECKVLLYIYLGVHPFDKDVDDAGETIDCVVAHSGALTDWAMNQIVDILEGENYNFVVCDVARDFVVGFSFQENLTQMVRRSKRIIFCVSHDWEPGNENFKLAWNIAQEKIKETKSHYGIIVSHGLPADAIQDKDLKLFMNRGRFIDASKRLFVEKVVYSMPQNIGRQSSRISLSQNKDCDPIEMNYYQRKRPSCFIEHTEDIRDDGVANDTGHKSHVFVSYADRDITYVTQVLQPLLEDKGYKTCIPDRDFVPGASKEENILGAISTSMRTIFLLSTSHLEDEWSLFTFRAACEKSLREKMNHLIVIIIEDIPLEDIDEEMRHYLKSYISLHVNDKWFKQRLFNGLPLLRGATELHTSPLFVQEGMINTNDLTIEFDVNKCRSDKQ